MRSFLNAWLLWIPLAALWLVVFRFLGVQWSLYEQYRYGWAVPFLCLCFAWNRWQDASKSFASRGEILAPFRGPESEPARPARIGLLLAACALLYLPLRIIQEANPVWRAASYGLCIIACLTTLALLWAADGWAWARRFVFPVCFALVGVPWPSALENAIVQTLSRWNASVTVEVLDLFGCPVLQHGNVLETAGGAVGVEEACSGIRSLQASLMLALAFGEVYRLRALPRLALVGAGGALAFGLNMARTSLLTWVTSSHGKDALAKWHDPASVTILVGCFICLFLLARAAGRARLSEGAEAQGAEFHSWPTKQTPVRSEEPALPECWTEDAGGKTFVSKPPKVKDFAPAYLRLLALALVLWIIGGEIAAEAWFRNRAYPEDTRLAWRVAVPPETARYRNSPLSDYVLNWLACDEHTSVVWESDPDHRWQLFYFRWLPARGLGRSAVIALSRTHRPDHCLPASGRTLLRELGIQQVDVGSLRLPFRTYEFDDQGTPLLVFHCLWEDGTPPDQIANLRENTRTRLEAALAGSRGVGQRSLEVAVWGYRDLETARAALAQELTLLVRSEGQSPQR